jgi:isopenicillin N synthase-like dioxygenase
MPNANAAFLVYVIASAAIYSAYGQSLQLPVIDLSALRQQSNGGGRAAMAEAVARASMDFGAFYVVGHGIPEHELKRILLASRSLFDLPFEQKSRHRIKRAGFTRGYIPIGGESGSHRFEVKEAFSYGYAWNAADEPKNPLQGPNAWPELNETFDKRARATLEEWFNHAVRVSRMVARALSLALDRPESFFEGYCDGGETISLMRLFHYDRGLLPAESENTRAYDNTSASCVENASERGSEPGGRGDRGLLPTRAENTCTCDKGISTCVDNSPTHRPEYAEMGSTEASDAEFHEQGRRANSWRGQERVGSSPHTDWGFITIILQDDVGGLQLWRDGRWYDVAPRAGALLVNGGDYLSLLTKGVFVSPLHRVVSTSRSRLSAVFFFYPHFEARIPSDQTDFGGSAQELSVLSQQGGGIEYDAHDRKPEHSWNAGSNEVFDRPFGAYIVDKWEQVSREDIEGANKNAERKQRWQS